jgi:hydrogenase nickel incorporation protein HypA/HybF
MHEYPLTKQIIDTALSHAGGKPVAAINLVVGDYSGVVADSIALYFDLIAEGTACEKAALNIERVAPMLRCKVCGALFERKPFAFACPVEGCPGEGEPTEIGREFYINSIEIEEI